MKSISDILLTTLIAVLFGTLVSFLIVIPFDTTGGAVFAAILTPFNILLPTLLGVCIFYFLKSNRFQWQQYTFFQQSFRLVIIFIAGLLLWAVLEVLVGAGIEASMLGKIKRTFVSQFLGFVPTAIAIAFAIPVIDKRLNANKPNTNTEIMDNH